MTFCGFFQSEVASTKEELFFFQDISILYHRLVRNKSLQTLGLTAYISSDANKRMRKRAVQD